VRERQESAKANERQESVLIDGYEWGEESAGDGDGKEREGEGRREVEWMRLFPDSGKPK
jgi:hypothetical protein